MNCRQIAVVLLLGIAGLVLGAAARSGAAPGGDDAAFARGAADVGIVVRDAAESTTFYTKAIGCREEATFQLPRELSQHLGLESGTASEVRVLTIGTGKDATRLKLIPCDKTQSSTARASGHGYRLLTIFVADIDVALDRLTKAEIEPLGDGVIALGGDAPNEVFFLTVKDPDGNLVELVGPKGER